MQDPSQRLGSQAGADEVRQHPWFAGVHWALGRSKEPLLRSASAAALSPNKSRKATRAKSMARPASTRSLPDTPVKTDSVSMGCFFSRRRRRV